MGIIYLNFITIIPIKPKSRMWMFLLSAYKLIVMVLNAMIDMYEKCIINPYNMSDSYSIIPRMNHYACIIDLFSPYYLFLSSIISLEMYIFPIILTLQFFPSLRVTSLIPMSSRSTSFHVSFIVLNKKCTGMTKL